MKTAVSLFGLLLLTAAAFSDPYVISKQQAHRAADQTEGASGSAAQSPPSAALPNTPPTDPALAATLQNIGSLRADIAAFNAAAGTEPDATQRISLLNHLSAAAQATKPSSSDVKKLADHLIAATLGRKIPAAQQARLARDIHALFNSAHLTAAQQEQMLADVQKMLTDAGTPLDDATNVVADLKTVAAATK
jgi:hypothetical protein